jgi:predicted transcriptional regulator/YHS domain-containing protein
MSLKDVARLMVEFDCGEIPVVDGGANRPVGVVTDRDITCRTVAQGKNPLDLSARDCMSAPVVTVTPDTPVEECCRTMEEHQLRRIPVVDEGGACCGIVSQADLALRMADTQAAHVVKEISRHSAPAQPTPAMATDPVCGMHVSMDAAASNAVFGGRTYYFCSEDCRERFNARPEDYAAPA